MLPKRMNSEARAIKARHHDVKHLFRYIFIWYSPNGGPVLPDTFRASAVPTWPQIDDILKKVCTSQPALGILSNASLDRLLYILM